MDPNAAPVPSPASLAWLSPGQAVTARALQEQLTGHGSPAVLAQLGQWLAELVRHEQYPLERWLDAVEQIDRLAELHRFRLVPQHLVAQNLQKLCDSDLWRATQTYRQRLDEACLHCLLRQPGAGGGQPPDLTPVLCRLLRNLARQHKSLLLASRPVEPRIWRDLGHAYLLAESWGLAERQCRLPDGGPSGTTPRQELLKLLMLAVATPDALSPVQLHVAERLAACLAGHFVLDSRPGPGCGFCFDLARELAPARLQASNPGAARQRFFGAGSAIPALQGLTLQLHRRGSLPPEAALGGEFQPADILAAITQLERQWADARPARRDERAAGRARLIVVPGLMAAIGWLAGGGLESPRSPRTELWEVIDHSRHGFGALLPDRPAGWLSVGALMAVRVEAGTAVRMGLTRRITATPDGRWHVGVELLGQQAQRVTLHPDLRQDSDGLPAGQAAILLSPPPTRTDAAELLLPAGILEHAASLQMRLGPDRYRLESPVTIGQGRDYRQVRYRLA